ncbi:MAG: hypothetical protein AAF384_12265 [Pseudomonadota bacterium]
MSTTRTARPGAAYSPALAAFTEDQYTLGDIYGMRTAVSTKAGTNGNNLVADLSALGKCLVVGPTAKSHLQSIGMPVPNALLEWSPLGADGCVAMLHRDRYLLSAPHAQARAIDALNGPTPEGVLVLPYDAADFAVHGDVADAFLREFAILDLQLQSAQGWIATRLAHCEVYLWRPLSHGLRLICTPADARFLLSTLTAVATEVGGSVVGFNDYVHYVNKGASA